MKILCLNRVYLNTILFCCSVSNIDRRACERRPKLAVQPYKYVHVRRRTSPYINYSYKFVYFVDAKWTRECEEKKNVNLCHLRIRLKHSPFYLFKEVPFWCPHFFSDDSFACSSKDSVICVPSSLKAFFISLSFLFNWISPFRMSSFIRIEKFTSDLRSPGTWACRASFSSRRIRSKSFIPSVAIFAIFAALAAVMSSLSLFFWDNWNKHDIWNHLILSECTRNWIRWPFSQHLLSLKEPQTFHKASLEHYSMNSVNENKV